ncbi:hypothetical protein ACWDG9_46070 [Streptomyces sp. NPDC001073]
MVADATAVMFRSASREAHRNGTTPPDWITATSLIAHGINPAPLDTAAVSRPAGHHSADLVAHTADGHTQLIQAAHRSQRPGTPPALAPQPPPPSATPAARTD